MENTILNNINEVKSELSNKVHHVLAHSYSVYFILFLVGVTLDLIYQVKIFQSPFLAPTGFTFLALATLLIFWAQSTTKHINKQNMTKETFCRGPYCYTRSPTHWGLFLLMLGFGILANALFVVIFTVIAFILTKLVFLKKEEAILAKKYGTPYLEYKKLVRF